MKRIQRPGKYVYFLRRKDGIGPVKIGCSLLPKIRLREFYRWSPYELEMLASAEGGHDIEAELHRMFVAYRLHMEWFAPSDRLMLLIARVHTGVPILEAMDLAAMGQPLTTPAQTPAREASAA